MDLNSKFYVYYQNLERLIRVRNINKNKIDFETELRSTLSDANFKKQMIADVEEMKIIKRLMKFQANPCFVKTHFKKETIEKYKNACGNYFGISNN